MTASTSFLILASQRPQGPLVADISGAPTFSERAQSVDLVALGTAADLSDDPRAVAEACVAGIRACVANIEVAEGYRLNDEKIKEQLKIRLENAVGLASRADAVASRPVGVAVAAPSPSSPFKLAPLSQRGMAGGLAKAPRPHGSSLSSSSRGAGSRHSKRAGLSKKGGKRVVACFDDGFLLSAGDGGAM